MEVQFFFDSSDGSSSGWKWRQTTVVMDDGSRGQLDFSSMAVTAAAADGSGGRRWSWWTAAVGYFFPSPVLAAAADGSGGSQQRMRATATGHSGRQRLDFSLMATAAAAVAVRVAAAAAAAAAVVSRDDDILSEPGGEQCKYYLTLYCSFI